MQCAYVMTIEAFVTSLEDFPISEIDCLPLAAFNLEYGPKIVKAHSLELSNSKNDPCV